MYIYEYIYTYDKLKKESSNGELTSRITNVLVLSVQKYIDMMIDHLIAHDMRQQLSQLYKKISPVYEYAL